MSNEAIKVLASAITLETSAAAISTNGFHACSTAVASAKIDGYPLGIFELTGLTFSATPKEGAILSVYERKSLDDSSQAPVPDANNRNDYIGSLVPDLDSGSQNLRIEGVPINFEGGEYYIEWRDGSTATASLNAGWKAVFIPFTYGT